MKKSTRNAIIVALVLCFAGIIICGLVLIAVKFDFSAFNTAKYQEKVHDIGEEFENIVIETDVSDVTFILSDSTESAVECFERENRKHSVYVKDGTLYIKETERRWYDNIGIFFGRDESITLRLSKTEFEKLSIETDTGDVNISENFVFDNIDIESDTGDIKVFAKAEKISVSTDTGDIFAEKLDVNSLSVDTDTGNINIYNANIAGKLGVETDTGKIHIADVSADNMSVESDTGDVLLEHTEVLGKLNVISDTGDVHFALSDADTIYVRTSTGDVTGTLLSEKIFTTHTSTGDVRVPNSRFGGACEIKTSTGDIEIGIENY